VWKNGVLTGGNWRQKKKRIDNVGKCEES